MHEASAPKLPDGLPETIEEFDPFQVLQERASLKGAMAGGYEIAHRISRGHTNDVYLAVHPILGTRAAIKVLNALRADFVDRFVSEARFAAGLRHPHIVQLFDLVTLADGRPCIVMEYLEGKTLEEFAGRTPMAPQRARSILLQICSALAATHERGIVHRDLKPQNVLLVGGSRRDYVKLLDFGVAKVESGLSPSVTAPGSVVGTPHYMSPEQVRGEAVDRRTDIYALGVLAFRLLTGSVPFDGSAAGVMLHHLSSAPPPLEGVPSELSRIVLKALAKDPADRFDDVVQFARALHQCSLTEAPQKPRSQLFISQVTPGRVLLRFISEEAFRHVDWYELSMGRVFVPGPPPMEREGLTLEVQVPGWPAAETPATVIGVFDGATAAKHGIQPGFALQLARPLDAARNRSRGPGQTMLFVDRGAKAEPDPAMREERKWRGGEEPMQNCDILVIEDDEATRQAIVEDLRGEGFVVAEAPDGKLGIAASRELHPRLIVLDMMMPVMNGWEVLAAMEKDPVIGAIPVIQASAFISGRTPPAVARLRKPIEHEQLVEVIRKYLPTSDPKQSFGT